jgi:hypothetical protein
MAAKLSAHHHFCYKQSTYKCLTILLAINSNGYNYNCNNFYASPIKDAKVSEILQSVITAE